jgi:hypothetical protein
MSDLSPLCAPKRTSSGGNARAALAAWANAYVYLLLRGNVTVAHGEPLRLRAMSRLVGELRGYGWPIERMSAWLAIQSRGPVCARWRSFVKFYRDVGPRPSWRHLLIRDDPTGAFEPGNTRWQIVARYR